MTETDLRVECARRGLVLRRQGVAWRIVGTGVDVLIGDLRQIKPQDLKPRRRNEGRAGAWSAHG